MNKNMGTIIGVVALVVVVGAVYLSMNLENDEENGEMARKIKAGQQAVQYQEIDEDKVMTQEEVVMEKEVLVEKKVVEEKGEVVANVDLPKRFSGYEAYSVDKLARAETGDVVLFFHASWCPSCRGLNSSIENNLKSIPEGVSILKTDYDKEAELKRKYGVTYQHTLVQVDKNGNMIKKWSGSSSLANLLAEIQ